MDHPSTSTGTSRRHNSNSRRNSTRFAAAELAGACLLARNRLFWGNHQSNKLSKPTRSTIPQLQGIAKKTSDATQTEKRKKKGTRRSVRSTATHSRENLEPLVKVKPEELTARCSAAHEGRRLLQERLTVRVDSLFNMLFSASSFLQGFHDRRKSTDLCMGGWTRNAAGQNERIVTVTVALDASLGPKTAKVTETQVMRECSHPGQLYSIDVQSVNEDIPYADTFVVLMHFCLKATVEQHTDVQVFAEVKFLKSVWAVVKVFIEKNAYAGLEEFCQSLYSALLNEIKRTNRSPEPH